MDAAGYRVIEDIRDYNKLGGMKKELSNTGMQVCVINQISECIGICYKILHSKYSYTC